MATTIEKADKLVEWVVTAVLEFEEETVPDEKAVRDD